MGVYNTLFSRVFSIFPIPSKKGKLCAEIYLYTCIHTRIYVCIYRYVHIFFLKKEDSSSLKRQKKLGGIKIYYGIEQFLV